MENFFFFSDTETASAHPQMDNETLHNMWKGFCLGSGNLTLRPIDEFRFVLGNPELPTLGPDGEFVLHVDEHGAAVVGRDYNCLVRGYLCLLMKIEFRGDRLALPCMTQKSDYRIRNRMLHICVFPENDFLFIKKLIRLAAVCQYTHLVIEFWGMLRYDCLKELAWPHAFSKEQVRELVRECREAGVEPIPMFNQLGHATASRLLNGKHVVLDQNPKLQRFFTPDGWAWNIESEEVLQLMKTVRGELYELFGAGEYIHLGCDEAYYLSRDEKLRQRLPEYLGRLTAEVEAEGRRPMIWMDMFLGPEVSHHECSSVGAEESKRLREATAKSSVFVDWQYNCTEVPIPSLMSLVGCGRDLMGAPWLKKENYEAHVATVAEHGLFGVMMTTWHTLKEDLPGILGCAKSFGATTFPWSASSGNREESATLLRRISFEGNRYEDTGWSKYQIEV